MSGVKQALRITARAMRKIAHERHCLAAAGASIGERLSSFGLGFATAGKLPAVVAGYAPIREEIDPSLLLLQARLDGARVVLPAIVGKEHPLEFRIVDFATKTKPGVWGIAEPPPTAEVLDPDLLLVPLLAFDRRGFRLGYGGGFYDRTLRKLRALKPIIAVGLAYDEQRIDAVPHLDYDEPLDWVLTPSGPVRCLG